MPEGRLQRTRNAYVTTCPEREAVKALMAWRPAYTDESYITINQAIRDSGPIVAMFNHLNFGNRFGRT